MLPHSQLAPKLLCKFGSSHKCVSKNPIDHTTTIRNWQRKYFQRTIPITTSIYKIFPIKFTNILRLFFVIVLAFVFLSTIIDFKASSPSKLGTRAFVRKENDGFIHLFTDPWLVAFSLRKNVNALCSLKRDPSDIQSIHGIRFLNALLLVVAHKSMALFFDPYMNRTQMAEVRMYIYNFD